MFCPFIKGACVSDCVFCNDDNTCNFINTIIKISKNTGADQTESWSINSRLGDISDKLDTIIKKI